MKFAPLTAVLLFLVACVGSADPQWASDAEISKHGYRGDTGPEIRLYTVVSTRNGSGAHSSLLIATNKERLLFDPAGSFALPNVPERNDVLYGITPKVLATYVNYHMRESYDVVEQRIRVTAAQAEQVAQLAKEYGSVPRAQCALAINRVLLQVEGFGNMRPTYFPKVTSSRFAAISGVSTRTFTDAGTNGTVLLLPSASAG